MQHIVEHPKWSTRWAPLAMNVFRRARACLVASVASCIRESCIRMPRSRESCIRGSKESLVEEYLEWGSTGRKDPQKTPHWLSGQKLSKQRLWLRLLEVPAISRHLKLSLKPNWKLEKSQIEKISYFSYRHQRPSDWRWGLANFAASQILSNPFCQVKEEE